MPAESPQIPNEPDDEPRVTQNDTHFGGRFLRFIGMLLIVGVIMFAGFLNHWRVSGSEFGVLLVIGLAGAAAHFTGRKLAPGKHWASIRGGLFAVIGLPIAGFFFLFVALKMIFGSPLAGAIGGVLECVMSWGQSCG